MFNKMIISILIICLLVSLESCCTLLGHAIGKSMDEKAKKEISYSVPDSLDIFADSTNVTIQESSETNYKTLFAILGAATDISLVVIGVMATNPMRMNLRI